MRLTFTDESGQQKPVVMGCYGIGVTRLLGAAIEQNHDERGIIWPEPIAPFSVVICPVNYRQSAAVRQVADELHEKLESAGIDVIIDDRGERPGSMFADWELIGVPHRITVGERGLKTGQVEYAHRRSLQANVVSLADAVGLVAQQIAAGRS